MVKDGFCIIVKMESSVGMGFYYMIIKNCCNIQVKLEFKKYDFVVKKYVVFWEKKV